MKELSEYLLDLDRINQEIEQEFSTLGNDVLNWKPQPNKWSVAQCCDHLIVTNKTYWPVIEDILADSYHPSSWSRINPFSNFFGKMLVKTMGPENRKKYKTSRVFQPDSSDFKKGFPEELIKNNNELKNKFASLLDLRKAEITITSPSSSIVTYKIKHLIAILVRHEERHILQAREVLQLYNKFFVNR